MRVGEGWDGWRQAVAMVLAVAAVLTPAAPASAQSCTWAGTWRTTWGDLEIEQLGNAAIAAYEYHNGAFLGLVRGNTLRGTWGEAPTYNAPDNAGELEFAMSPDCSSFAGGWRYGSYSAAQSWTARRLSTGVGRALTTGCPWTGSFDTNFGTMIMQEAGNVVTGYYESRSGQLSLISNGAYAGGTWGEFPSGSGEAEFIQASDCSVWIGRWRTGSNGDWSIWIGTRL